MTTEEHELGRFLAETIRDAPTREIATARTRINFSQHMWLVLEDPRFDVLAVRADGSRVIVKFWIQPSGKELPSFYMKKFIIDLQDYMLENNIIDNVHVFLVSNTFPSDDAWDFHEKHGRLYYRLLFTFARDSGELDPLVEYAALRRRGRRRKGVPGSQKELVEYMQVA